MGAGILCVARCSRCERRVGCAVAGSAVGGLMDVMGEPGCTALRVRLRDGPARDGAGSAIAGGLVAPVMDLPEDASLEST